ncbi:MULTISPECIES: IclR family transcriptional regulator [unclassified Gordonia (in: high G+C Gram-positive bacteria)]|uniref:IclR family transcriptional regulator n=1 Tax=unclassified Gordonia (in: high G+C Gram-positive bacteria) TaxID=2657482 RepID=UPI001FFF3FC1|nr:MULTISPECIES: IclR family transcriptional regulator [unclassified Gordonia (in: high G+C Gram-positive bacteria)]UQE73492.1 IclR family transcriptional regulator [Gordonia sp. PP30]
MSTPDSVLGKVMLILHAFDVDDHDLPLAEIVRRTGLHKATAHRLAGDLVDARLLDRTDGGYRLSGGLFELGMRASVERGLLEIAMPFLQDLYERTHETVHLGVLDGHEVMYVAKIGGHRQANAPSRTGGRMPLHCTGIGKSLLAHTTPEVRREVLAGPLERRTPRTIVAPGLLSAALDTVRERGVAFEYEESTPGIACVSAPILDVRDNSVIAALSATGPLRRFRPEQHVDAVRAAAGGVAATLARRRALRD